MNPPSTIRQELSKYRISRRGRKLQVFDEQRLFHLLPRDVPERTWADIMEKEEIDLMILDLREEIFDEAFNVCYGRYMERQTVNFTSYCTAQALLKLIDWLFYRHDPGEEGDNPKCDIPNRPESWAQDRIPDFSPLDTWSAEDLDVIEGSTCDEEALRSPSADSLTYPPLKEIPKKYWFPGKVCIGVPETTAQKKHRPDGTGAEFDFVDSSQYASETLSDRIAAENEILQKVTDYGEVESKQATTPSDLKAATVEPVQELSLKGAGDSTASTMSRSRASTKRPSSQMKSKSRLPQWIPSRQLLSDQLSDQSKYGLSVISDCRLRNLRLETQYEISPERDNEPQPRDEKTVKKKKVKKTSSNDLHL